MITNLFKIKTITLVGVLVFALSACDSIPVITQKGPAEDPGDAQSETARVSPLEETIIAPLETPLEVTNETVRESLTRAARSLPPYSHEEYLSAAEQLVKLQRIDEAKTVLEFIDGQTTPPTFEVRRRLVAAQIAYLEDNPDLALRLVNRNAGIVAADSEYLSATLLLKAQLELQKGDSMAAIETWVRRYQYLTGEAEIAENNRFIWEALGQLIELDLQLARQTNTQPLLSAWFDLATLALEFRGDRYGFRQAVARWAALNPQHPAESFAQTLVHPGSPQLGGKIALLLPLSSNFGGAARIVQDGFNAAWRMDSDPTRPDVIVYDIGEDPGSATGYLNIAVAEGATVVVGPLGKEAVETVAQFGEFTQPTLLLGDPGYNVPILGVHHFDLSPEPEARQIATRMFRDHQRRIVALYPNNDWGQRVHSAFAAQWENLGGTIIESQSFNPNADDFSGPIKALFDLSNSQTRNALLSSRTGLGLKVEPRRRQDIDAIFLAARYPQARLIRPQINFFQGHRLPVYATSHTYSGQPDPVNDTDLNGITFVDMPWVTNDSARNRKLRQTFQDAGNPSAANRLFAFGFDAYQLALAMPVTGAVRIDGLNARMTIDARGAVQRTLESSEFRNGLPSPIVRF